MHLDSANLEDVKIIQASSIFKGITTNPTILVKEKCNRQTAINRILELTDKQVLVQTVGFSYEEILADARMLLAMFGKEKIAIKIPAHEAGINVIDTLKKEDKTIQILGTAIYSADQAIAAALAGADFVAPYVNRMSAANIDPFKEIAGMRHFFDKKALKTQIMAASFKHSGQVMQAYESGADTVTIPYEIYLQMTNKVLAVEAIRVFNKDATLYEK
ncbi:transaldolase [Listeria monocytogenes]